MWQSGPEIVCRVRAVVFFFFSSRRRHTRYWRDWSSDVCSSDLPLCFPRRSIPSDLENREFSFSAFLPRPQAIFERLLSASGLVTSPAERRSPAARIASGERTPKEALGQLEILADVVVGSLVAHELRRLLLSRVLPSSLHP